MPVPTDLNDAPKDFPLTEQSPKPIRQNKEAARESAGWRSLFDSLLDLSYSQARESILQFVSRRYLLSSLDWLERKGNRLETVRSSVESHLQKKLLSISVDDRRLLDAVENKSSFTLPAEQNAKNSDAPSPIHLFPIAVGREIRGALMVGDDIASENTKRFLTLFCQAIAPELEILRLREELDKRASLDSNVQKFNESIKDTDKDIDTADFWSSLMHTCAELLRAERVSLLVFDEAANFFSAKAATGSRADIIKADTEKLGERIARQVLQSGKPLVVEDVRLTETSAAPAEWNYKSNSFISYPIMFRGRKIGVLNLTDRAGSENFSKLDLEILSAVMPQLAVLVNNALLKGKVGELKRLSVTDALTGLLNRLYLDERLPEEIRRSNRENFPMSFLMIDVDDFKSYNDSFGHTEGDKALKLVAHCLKETLRGADVAVRYGGDEFSILLPQTTSEEAAKIAERIREQVATTQFPNRHITISVGVLSCVNTACEAAEIIKWADEALYEAKRRGKNNMQICQNLYAAQEC
jgi:diguanylate cyclase (GGDEF)-like protein